MFIYIYKYKHIYKYIYIHIHIYMGSDLLHGEDGGVRHPHLLARPVHPLPASRGVLLTT